MTLLDAVRRPAYTGANRCWPCTVVNLVAVAVVAAVVGLLFVPAGVAALAVGVLLVSLRGYVVPYTPRFAPRLVAPLPVDFGHDGADVDSGSIATDVDPERLLNELGKAGVVEPGDGDELRLDAAFRTALDDRMADLRGLSDHELAARVAGVVPDGVETEAHGDRILLAGDRDVWLSRPVAIAETAAAETLAEWGLPDDLCAPAADPLRTFLTTCPSCGSDVRETTLRECCSRPGTTQRRPELPVLACEACDAVVYEFGDEGRVGDER